MKKEQEIRKSLSPIPKESLINSDFPAAHGWAAIFRTDKSLKM